MIIKRIKLNDSSYLKELQMRIEDNTLLDRKIIKSRLKILKEGYASCTIEGLYIIGDNKNFMENR